MKKKLLSVVLIMMTGLIFAERYRIPSFSSGKRSSSVKNYHVGDIVLEDGSLVTADNITESQKRKAVAVIFYVEQKNSALKGKLGGKVLGFGLNSTTASWCTDEAPFRYDDPEVLWDILFTNGKEGEERIKYAHKFLAADSKKFSVNDYPAYEYCWNYRKTKSSYNKGWYLPTAEEIKQLEGNLAKVSWAMYKAGANKTFCTKKIAEEDPNLTAIQNGYKFKDGKAAVGMTEIWLGNSDIHSLRQVNSSSKNEYALYLSAYEIDNGAETFRVDRKSKWQQIRVFPVYAFVENDVYICKNCKSEYTLKKDLENCQQKKGCAGYREIIPEYSVGDVILKNGKVVRKADLTEDYKSEVECVVFYAGKKSTDPLGARVLALNVNITEECDVLTNYDYFNQKEYWPNKPYKFIDKSINGYTCWHVPYKMKYQQYNAESFDDPSVRFICGDDDGSDNWDVICSLYPELKSKKKEAFPALDFMEKNYGKGYYVPSYQEATYLMMNIHKAASEAAPVWGLNNIYTFSFSSSRYSSRWTATTWEGSRIYSFIGDVEQKQNLAVIKRLQ